MSARLSLAQQLALLEEPTPIDLDPEGAHAREFNAHDISSIDPAAREHYLDVGPSTLRKQHDSITDPKYEGVRRTRKQILEEDSEDEMSEGESDRNSIRGSSPAGRGDEESEDDVPSESDEEKDSHHIQNEVLSKRPVEEQELVEDLSSTLRKTRDEDRKKGMAVSRQIALWDSLLDARIRLQKSVTAANRLPMPLELKEYSAMPECQESIMKMLHQATALSEEIFGLQEYLLVSNESITPPPRKRQKLQPSEDTTAEYATWLEDATEDLSALEETYHPHLIQTLSKWSAKIQAVAPSVLLPSNRNAFTKGSQNTKSILQLIDETLVDQNKIIARTRIRRGKGGRIGVTYKVDEEQPEEDPEIFDDTDFYQQLLRDIIDARGNATGGNDDWMAAQKQKKAKKKVDTKASKGRKLRYEPHEKLQNFMVPVPVIGWHEEQIDELFASLLGRGFESSAAQDDEIETRRRLDEQLGAALKGGFRVFG